MTTQHEVNELVSDILHLLQREAVGAKIMISEAREGDFPGQIEVLRRNGDWYTVTIKGV